MKTQILIVLVLGTLLASCDQAKALELGACATGDDKLSIALKDPKRAKAYLEELGERLEAKDPEAVKESADLVARILECVPD